MKNIYEFSIYHENSKLRANDIELYSWIGLINSDVRIRKVISKPYLNYGNDNSDILLPNCETTNDKTLLDTLKFRRSDRTFNGAECELGIFSSVLKNSVGENFTQEYEDGVSWAFRPYPSGGGLYPIEIYVFVKNVKNLESAIYFYNPKKHSLSLVENENILDKLKTGMPTLENEIDQSSFIIFLVSNMSKISFKYMERSYRFALLECGHIAQNLLLTTSSYSLKSFPVGAFMDDNINSLLKLNTINSNVQYIIFNS